MIYEHIQKNKKKNQTKNKKQKKNNTTIQQNNKTTIRSQKLYRAVHQHNITLIHNTSI